MGQHMGVEAQVMGQYMTDEAETEAILPDFTLDVQLKSFLFEINGTAGSVLSQGMDDHCIQRLGLRVKLITLIIKWNWGRMKLCGLFRISVSGLNFKTVTLS